MRQQLLPSAMQAWPGRNLGRPGRAPPVPSVGATATVTADDTAAVEDDVMPPAPLAPNALRVLLEELIRELKAVPVVGDALPCR